MQQGSTPHLNQSITQIVTTEKGGQLTLWLTNAYSSMDVTYVKRDLYNIQTTYNNINHILTHSSLHKCTVLTNYTQPNTQHTCTTDEHSPTPTHTAPHPPPHTHSLTFFIPGGTSFPLIVLTRILNKCNQNLGLCSM